MQKIDRRAARTRTALHKALLSLVERKGYEEVSIRELIEEADVGRSTFYAHYAGKEDLLRSGFDNLRRELAEAMKEEQGAVPFRFSRTMFEHAARHVGIYHAMTGSPGNVIAIGEIGRILTEFVRRELSETEDDGGVPREVRIQFVVGTLVNLLTWWLERRPDLPPAEVDAMFRRLALHGTGDILPTGMRENR
ncbi:TetR/AcrR family transcriptional regulator [Parvibaculum sp.]|uniref:TetR/AcrR family transcriptional regulator n=1 Tax=Parvibaculum sp. TaxID=2024848 RepID=UPI0025D40CA9|nr:TetR/AcrR family transcriptional regulator [Parvibaculum sp.]